MPTKNHLKSTEKQLSVINKSRVRLSNNTRQPATVSRVFELAKYYEMVFLKILPSAYVDGGFS